MSAEDPPETVTNEAGFQLQVSAPVPSCPAAARAIRDQWTPPPRRAPRQHALSPTAMGATGGEGGGLAGRASVWSEPIAPDVV